MTEQILLGLLLSTVVGGLGYWRRALTASGLVGAILVGTLIFGFGGWIWGLLLVTFFVSSSLLSHYRRIDKELVTEKFAKDNRRDVGQALANGGLGATLAVTFALEPSPLLFAAFLGVMATVNADTWATELGILSRVPPRLVTTGQEVAAGTSGAVSRLGMWASVAGALLIGTVATALTQVASLVNGTGWSLRAASFPLVALVGGLVGSLFDSFLGATVQGIYYCDRCAKETERPNHHCGATARPLRGWGWLNNDLVNFTASIVGGLVAVALAWLLWK
jgi:uncharacterized protein (TIGR00297 family)